MSMTLGDAARVLALAQTFDNRKVDELTAASWHTVIGHLNFDDACQAVRTHYSRSRDWMMPLDVAEGVKQARADRLSRIVEQPPAADPDDVPAYLEALRAGRQLTASDTSARDMRQLTRVFTHVDDATRPDTHTWVQRAMAWKRNRHEQQTPDVDTEKAARLAQARAELDALRLAQALANPADDGGAVHTGPNISGPGPAHASLSTTDQAGGA